MAYNRKLRGIESMVYTTGFKIEFKRDIAKILLLALVLEEFLHNDTHCMHSVLGIGESLDAVVYRNIIVRQDHQYKFRL